MKESTNPATPAPYLQATNRIFEEEVIRNGDFAALDKVYTREARILPPGAGMIAGRDDIRDFWKDTVSEFGVTSVRLSTVELEFLGDSAVEIGDAIIAAGVSTAEMKYVVLWKREDGAWKWHIDIWNDAP